MDLAANFTLSSIAASLVVSMVGFVLFQYGRKEARFPQLLTGLALLILPLFVPEALPMLGVSGACVGGMWIALRAGM
ncbi:MAG TPA: hypothetical protein ENJ09_13895 [Planctomycetes bacterium]|nr:hypothetical protein [Planctomycetota bacterium]